WFGPTQNPRFTPKQRFAPWAYGLPLLTTNYDVSGHKLKEIENIYDFTYAQTIVDFCTLGHGLSCNASGLLTSLVSVKCDVLQSYSQRKTDWADPAQYNTTYITSASNADIGVDYYSMYTGRTILNSTRERTYRKTDVTQLVEKRTDYNYNLTNFEPNQVITYESNGDITEKDIAYTCDYSGGVITNLNNANILSVPVETKTTFYRPTSGITKALSEQVTEFVQVANGDIRPSRVLEQRFTQPQTTVTYYGGPGSNISAYKVIQTNTYDASSNLTGVKDEANRSVANIYGYKDKYIIGTVNNCDPSVDHPAYTSFEESGLSNPGGWVIGSIVSYNNASIPAVTGQYTFALLSQNANSLTASSLNTAKPYTLSFWANNGNVTVTGGATLAKTGPTYNGYTYYEYDIAAGTTSVLLKNANATTNANIDELRLYPKSARMRSVTYDEIIGKTSECDENNRIIYYEYDNVARLRFIRDESRNIVKMFEYNNVSAAKQNGCPGTYSNHFISETFTRNNCAAGTAGTDVTITVAAATYTSTISQADADAKAENWLVTNGQVNANASGGCATI
ncbi:MAG TPA: DUF5977 domain-containing protein, partial [Chitinophagaceae bacterium]